MDKEKFIIELRKKLNKLPKEEIENAITYYEEYINDSENEEEAIKKLGDPSKVASEIMLNYVTKETKEDNKSSKSKLSIFLIIVLAIITSPISLVFAITIIVIIFTIILLICVFGLVGITLLIYSIICIGIAIYFLIASDIPSMVFYIGYAFVSTGIGTIFVIGSKKFLKQSLYLLAKNFSKYISKKEVKNEVEK